MPCKDRQAGDKKGVTIEVTPEMIEAGVKALHQELDWGDGVALGINFEDAVCAILSAVLPDIQVQSKSEAVHQDS